MTHADVRAIRGALTQEAFARKLRLSVATVHHWEQGLRSPTGAHVLMLEAIRDNMAGGRKKLVGVTARVAYSHVKGWLLTHGMSICIAFARGGSSKK